MSAEEMSFAGLVRARARVVAIPDQVGSAVSGETVILSLRNGVYYGLDEVGSAIWRYIAEPKTVEDIRDQLMSEYEVDAEECEREIARFVAELKRNELVELLAG